MLGDFYDSFEPALLLALKKAFRLRSDAQARNESRPVPTIAEEPGNFFDAAVKMWSALPRWRKPVMSAALRELIATEDASGLQVILAMIKSSTQHCTGGKVDVWSRLLLRVIPRTTTHGRTGSSSSGGVGSAVPCECARCSLWEEALLFSDDWKEKAFSTVFLEPTKMHYQAVQEPDIMDNVEVHGSSAYLAVLLSTLGVQCPRIPFLWMCLSASYRFLTQWMKTSWQPFGDRTISASPTLQSLSVRFHA